VHCDRPAAIDLLISAPISPPRPARRGRKVRPSPVPLPSTSRTPSGLGEWGRSCNMRAKQCQGAWARIRARSPHWIHNQERKDYHQGRHHRRILPEVRSSAHLIQTSLPFVDERKYILCQKFDSIVGQPSTMLSTALIYLRGSTWRPLTRTSKCKLAPVVRPVRPTWPRVSPAAICCPGRTSIVCRWA